MYKPDLQPIKTKYFVKKLFFGFQKYFLSEGNNSSLIPLLFHNICFHGINIDSILR